MTGIHLVISGFLFYALYKIYGVRSQNDYPKNIESYHEIISSYIDLRRLYCLSHHLLMACPLLGAGAGSGGGRGK